jgi:hypothetical protein
MLHQEDQIQRSPPCLAPLFLWKPYGNKTRQGFLVQPCLSWTPGASPWSGNSSHAVCSLCASPRAPGQPAHAAAPSLCVLFVAQHSSTKTWSSSHGQEQPPTPLHSLVTWSVSMGRSHQQEYNLSKSVVVSSDIANSNHVVWWSGTNGEQRPEEEKRGERTPK